MQVEVLFFGPVRELAGAERTAHSLVEGATVSALAEALLEGYPNLRASLPTLRFAVNRSFVDRGHVLANGDEVALIPPVSGG